MIVLFSSSNKMRCSVLNSLKFVQFPFWKTIKDTVTVVQL